MRMLSRGFIDNEEIIIDHLTNQNLPPINIVQIEKNFSENVLAETFPKPTEVKLLHVKYNAVM